MESGKDRVYFIFAMMPIFCQGIDTGLLSNLKNSFRTENTTISYNILGNFDQLDFRDKYFDMLYRFVQSSRNSFMPGSEMRRTLRSFEASNPFLTSIKREKEVYEDLEDLQYFGSEIPKKFAEKRLSSPAHFSEGNTQQNSGKGLYSLENINPYSAERILKSEIASGIREQLKLDNSVKNGYQSVSNFPELSKTPENAPELSNIPVIPDNFPQSEASAIRETSEISNLTASSPDGGTNVVISKRRFPPRGGRPEEEDVCNMDDLEIDIRFREMMDTDRGSFLLTCTGSVVVKKCEGACNSQVKPSVNNYDGFERQCSCCKDTSVRSRTITLSICTLGPEEVHGYSISRTIVEPTACSCQECRD